MNQKETCDAAEESINWIALRAEISDLPALAETLEKKAKWLRGLLEK